MGSNNENQQRSHNDDCDDSDSNNPFEVLRQEGVSPKEILVRLRPNLEIPPHMNDDELWKLIISLLEPPKRRKLPEYNTFEQAVDLIKKSNRIVVLSGAGISTSAGLPDFRSRNGIYVQIHAEHPDLEDPSLMFNIAYFRRNPHPFYQFAKALFPGQYKPTIGHQFIKCIEEHGKLLRNYTQNIDTLERQANIRRVVECHGSFAKATCTNCQYCVNGEEISHHIFAHEVPKCPKCHAANQPPPQDGLGVMKPNIVFFGEQLDDKFHDAFEADKDRVDLLIVIGSSLKVRPVALIPRSLDAEVPQILINKETLNHMEFDIELLGDCDTILQELCYRLGNDWTKLCPPNYKPMTQLSGLSAIKQYLCPPNKETENMTNNDDENEGNDEDADWQDVEILDDPTDPNQLIHINIPKSEFVYLEPFRYLFNDAELTRCQLDSYAARDL